MEWNSFACTKLAYKNTEIKAAWPVLENNNYMYSITRLQKHQWVQNWAFLGSNDIFKQGPRRRLL